MDSLRETLEALANFGDEACVLAGGTDVMVQVARGEIRPDVLIHIERVPGLANIERNGHVRLGALATHRAIAGSQDMGDGYSSLPSAAGAIGGWQTQAVGTLGGNLGNASPAADLLPPLLVHGAQVELASVAGTRRVALDQFLVGRRVTARRADELIIGVELEPVPQRSADSFVKVGRRSAMEVSIVGVAMRLTLDEELSKVLDARIAVCSCGPLAFRATEAEHVLVGQELSTDVIAAAGAALLGRAQPIDDIRASATYRRRLLPRVLGKALEDCRRTIVGESGGPT